LNGRSSARKNPGPRSFREAHKIDRDIDLQIFCRVGYFFVRFVFDVDQLIEAGGQTPSHLVAGRRAKGIPENFKLGAVVQLK
jgi:hypothetical protein